MATKKKPAPKMKSPASRYTGGAKKVVGATSSTSRTAPGKTASKTPTKTSKTAPGKTAAKKPSSYAGWKNPFSPTKKYAGKKSTAKKTPAKKTPSKPKFPSIQDYLAADEYYQTGLSDLDWALEQFLLENDAAEGDVGASFGSAMGYMNLDKEKALKFMKDDFGARGLNFSGLYPEAVSDYNKEWSMGAADLNRDLASQMRDLGFEENNMRQSTDMQKRDLRLDAIRRRAEEIQQSQFNNPAGYKKPGAKKTPAKKSSNPGKKTTSPKKTGTRKTGVRKLRKY
jgi:hypothetical protein